jgi:hypothetical protein
VLYLHVRLASGMGRVSTCFSGVSGGLYQVNWQLNFAINTIYLYIIHNWTLLAVHALLPSQARSFDRPKPSADLLLTCTQNMRVKDPLHLTKSSINHTS